VAHLLGCATAALILFDATGYESVYKLVFFVIFFV